MKTQRKWESEKLVKQRATNIKDFLDVGEIELENGIQWVCSLKNVRLSEWGYVGS